MSINLIFQKSVNWLVSFLPAALFQKFATLFFSLKIYQLFVYIYNQMFALGIIAQTVKLRPIFLWSYIEKWIQVAVISCQHLNSYFFYQIVFKYRNEEIRKQFFLKCETKKCRVNSETFFISNLVKNCFLIKTLTFLYENKIAKITTLDW